MRFVFANAKQGMRPTGYERALDLVERESNVVDRFRLRSFYWTYVASKESIQGIINQELAPK